MEALIRRHDELERDLTAIENKLEVRSWLYSLNNAMLLCIMVLCDFKYYYLTSLFSNLSLNVTLQSAQKCSSYYLKKKLSKNFTDVLNLKV